MTLAAAAQGKTLGTNPENRSGSAALERRQEHPLPGSPRSASVTGPSVRGGMKEDRRFRRHRTRTAGDAALARGMTCSRSDHTWRLIVSVASGQGVLAHTIRRAEAGVVARGLPPRSAHLERPHCLSSKRQPSDPHGPAAARALTTRPDGSEGSRNEMEAQTKKAHALCRGRVAGALFGSARLLRRLRSRLLFHVKVGGQIRSLTLARTYHHDRRHHTLSEFGDDDRCIVLRLQTGKV